MTDQMADAPVLRVTRGALTPEELAALTAVLYARAAACPQAAEACRRVLAGWNRLELSRAYDGPRSWRTLAA